MRRATQRAREEAEARVTEAERAAEIEEANARPKGAKAAATGANEVTGEVSGIATDAYAATDSLVGPSSADSIFGSGGSRLCLDDATATAWRHSGSSVLWVLVGGEPAAACELSDAVRSEARAAVAALGGLGVEVTMLTGDCEANAQAVRAVVGIKEARSGVGTPLGRGEMEMGHWGWRSQCLQVTVNARAVRAVTKKR
jgi:cation transport ATPase